MKKEPLSIKSVPAPSVLKLKKQLEFDRDTQEAVWSALEALTAPELEIRQQGFEKLVQQDVLRRSPLAAYVLATRLIEPDLSLRRSIVRGLAGLISPAPNVPAPAGAVLTYLHGYLSQMRTRPIFALLQVADYDPESAPQVAALLKACSFAGVQLAQIFSNHACPVRIRRQAITFTSQIGFLAALPALERMVRRLEARSSAGSMLRLTSAEQEDEASLLPYMRAALEQLKSI